MSNHKTKFQNYFGVTPLVVVPMAAVGLTALLFSDDFWFTVAAVAAGAFVGLVGQAFLESKK